LIRRAVRATALEILGRLRPFSRETTVRFLYGHSMSVEERATFRATLGMLRNHFEFVSVPHAVELVRTRPASGRYLCFSFDDGFRDNHDVIAPTLADAGATACFFVAANLVAGSDEVRRSILRDRLHTSPDRPTMTVPMLRELSRAGFTIGCHTRDHVDLAAISVDEATEQVLGSQADVAAAIGAPCAYFAWPYGRRANLPEAVLRAVAPHFTAVFSAIRSDSVFSYDGMAINRDHFEPGWPTAHVRYFAARPLPLTAGMHEDGA